AILGGQAAAIAFNHVVTAERAAGQRNGATGVPQAAATDVGKYSELVKMVAGQGAIGERDRTARVVEAGAERRDVGADGGAARNCDRAAAAVQSASGIGGVSGERRPRDRGRAPAHGRQAAAAGSCAVAADCAIVERGHAPLEGGQATSVWGGVS